MAEAAMTGKRLKFMRAVLDFDGLTMAVVGLGSNLRRQGGPQKFIAPVAIIKPIDSHSRNLRSDGASWDRVWMVSPSLPLRGSRRMTTIWLLFWLATSKKLPLGSRANSRGGLLHRAALQQAQLAVILAHRIHHDLVGSAAVADIEESAVGRQVQPSGRLGRSILLLGQGRRWRSIRLPSWASNVTTSPLISKVR